MGPDTRARAQATSPCHPSPIPKTLMHPLARTALLFSPARISCSRREAIACREEDEAMSDEKPADKDKKPDIVVDEDWKSEAEAEKQKLAEQEQSPEAAGADQAAEKEPANLPPASFATLVSGLVTQILFALGAIEDPQTRRRYRNLAMAKHHIDTLAVLEEKTGGNLTEEEKKLLDNALYEVRMRYVQVAQTG